MSSLITIAVLFIILVFAVVYFNMEDKDKGVLYMNDDTLIARELTLIGASIMKMEGKEKVDLPIKDFTVKAYGMNDIDHTFTLNNKDIHMIVKTKDNEFFDDYTIRKVFLHEFAHVMDSGDDGSHGESFKVMYKEVIARAKSLNLFSVDERLDKNDMNKSVTNYPCGGV